MVEYKKQDIDEFRHFIMKKCSYRRRYDGRGNNDENEFPHFSNNKLNDLFRRNYPVISKIIALAVLREGNKLDSLRFLNYGGGLRDYYSIVGLFAFIISLENVDSKIIFDKEFLKFMDIFSISIESDTNMIMSLLLLNEKENYYETIGNIFSSNECNLWFRYNNFNNPILIKLKNLFNIHEYTNLNKKGYLENAFIHYAYANLDCDMENLKEAYRLFRDNYDEYQEMCELNNVKEFSFFTFEKEAIEFFEYYFNSLICDSKEKQKRLENRHI